mgnify:CR=1 FL=1
MPVATYYGNSPDEQADLLELRRAHYETLRHLEKQAARYGDAVPVHIAAGIKEAEASIRAIDDKLRSPIDTATAQRLGTPGQFSVLALRLDHLAAQMRTMQTQSDDWREAERQARQDAQRINRMIFTAIGVVLLVLARTLIGLAAAIVFRGT